MRTGNATAARRANYNMGVFAALPHIRSARSVGAKCAEAIAEFLNSKQIAARMSEQWTCHAVLRCLRRLKVVALDKGSLLPSAARSRRYQPKRSRLCRGTREAPGGRF